MVMFLRNRKHVLKVPWFASVELETCFRETWLAAASMSSSHAQRMIREMACLKSIYFGMMLLMSLCWSLDQFFSLPDRCWLVTAQTGLILMCWTCINFCLMLLTHNILEVLSDYCRLITGNIWYAWWNVSVFILLLQTVQCPGFSCMAERNITSERKPLLPPKFPADALSMSSIYGSSFHSSFLSSGLCCVGHCPAFCLYPLLFPGSVVCVEKSAVCFGWDQTI